jgi:hypothetical protein
VGSIRAQTIESDGILPILVVKMVNVPINNEWSWNNNFNAGFGGAEGTYSQSSCVFMVFS